MSCQSDEGGYVLRRARRDTGERNVIFVNPWDVIHEDGRDGSELRLCGEKDEV